MNEDEQKEGDPESSDTPDWDGLDTVIVAIIGALYLVQILVGSLQATPHQMVCDPRHGERWTGINSESSRKTTDSSL